MSRRVLVCDDEELLCAVIQEYLSNHGYEVEYATTAVDCIRKLREYDPHILILDAQFPNTRGLNALKKLREFGCDLPILLVSGVDEVGSSKEAKENGATSYLAKPFNVKAVKDQLVQMLPEAA